MFDKMKNIKNKMVLIVSFLLFYCGFLTILSHVVLQKFFGNIDLLLVPTMISEGLTKGLSFSIVFRYFLVFAGSPLLVTSLLFYIFKKFNLEKKREFSVIYVGIYLFIIYMLASYASLGYVTIDMFFKLYFIFYFVYLIIQGREFRRNTIFFSSLMFVVGMVIFICCTYDFSVFFDNVCENYKMVDTQKLKMKDKRNVIVIFAESFEVKHSVVEEKDKIFKINDDDAVKFSNFIEIKGKRATSASLQSALNGAFSQQYCVNHYKFSNKDYEKENIDFSKLGVGNVLAHNGYKNLFVKAASLSFANTDKTVLNQSFKSENMYGQHSFSWWEDFEKKNNIAWWGPKDKDVMELFKQKILEIDNKEPFLAIMFTADWHMNCFGMVNPYFDNDEDIKKSTINNFNNFIDWFKKQDFYDNTTLVIVADHGKMGFGGTNGLRLYNAFFNLPERLKNNLNTDKIINQLDMAPSILEIAGVELPGRQYGLGYSIFSEFENNVGR